ncbi:50S ribosomal protein L32 [Candidatus Hodgkinia cicadicola]|uniref:50S ribosomal protein L32 n=1 Tax=Candidatus Hodgkinia cicadicola TaxID=573658 RepID=A0ABX4MK68_9HYPH|nr:50S ribosomal protein L32 [Candidatus Hodgkinia cicadicola]
MDHLDPLAPVVPLSAPRTNVALSDPFSAHKRCFWEGIIYIVRFNNLIYNLTCWEVIESSLFKISVQVNTWFKTSDKSFPNL